MNAYERIKMFTMKSMKKRQNLIEKEILAEKDSLLVFQENTIFGSPSTAAAMVRANNTNGWTEWKYGDGRTLDEVKRQGE